MAGFCRAKDGDHPENHADSEPKRRRAEAEASTQFQDRAA
jgi:hypothetical protein